MPRTDRRYKRWFVGVEEHELRGTARTPLHRRAYKKNPTSDPKFIGGVHTTTAWIEKQTILDVFEAHGFDVQVAHEVTDNRSGPAASVLRAEGVTHAQGRRGRGPGGRPRGPGVQPGPGDLRGDRHARPRSPS